MTSCFGTAAPQRAPCRTAPSANACMWVAVGGRHGDARYIIRQLDPYVESDYVIVLLYSGMKHKVTWTWLRQAYNMLDRKYVRPLSPPPPPTRRRSRKDGWPRTTRGGHALRYKKNLKNLFVVHPSFWHKLLMSFAEWFIRCDVGRLAGTTGAPRLTSRWWRGRSAQPGRGRSAKFAKKIVYINRLDELEQHMALEQLDIPDEVRKVDGTLPPGKVWTRPFLRLAACAPNTRSLQSVCGSTQPSRHRVRRLARPSRPASMGGPWARPWPTAVFRLPWCFPCSRSGARVCPPAGHTAHTHHARADQRIVTVCEPGSSAAGLLVEGIFRRSPSAALLVHTKERLHRGEDLTAAAWQRVLGPWLTHTYARSCFGRCPCRAGGGDTAVTSGGSRSEPTGHSCFSRFTQNVPA